MTESEEASHDDLLLHNDVIRLSIGKERFSELHDQVVDFLRKSQMKAASGHLCFRECRNSYPICSYKEEGKQSWT